MKWAIQMGTPTILFLIKKETLEYIIDIEKYLCISRSTHSISMKIEDKRVGRLPLERIQDEKSHTAKTMLRACPQLIL